jgi:type I restriction enzyme M protein
MQEGTQQRVARLTTLNSRVRLRNLERTLMSMADTIRKGPGTSQAYLGILVGLLFIKRASDQFSNTQQDLINRLVASGIPEEEASLEAEYPENYLDSTLFCPPEARWVTADGKGICQAPEIGLGNMLRDAVRMLEMRNPRMGNALSTSVNFSATEGNKRILKDVDYKRLIDQMNFDLSDKSLEFPDIMGAAYEFTVRNFTQHEEGRDAGAHYTPREIVDLLVRILDPINGDSVYDPSSGSGGMLIYSKNHVEFREGSSENLWLYGQELKGTSWAMSVINMMFHGVVNFRIEQGDTLTSPRHRKPGGGIRRFSKIIANMPFSMKYASNQLTFNQRFSIGYPSENYADFLFIQHMLSSLEAHGKIATVCSIGILFREKKELVIRRSLIERDVIEAVIALPDNLFKNTGTTVAILVLRKRSLEKEPKLRNNILFINAENEFADKARQSYLRPKDIEKIHRHYSEIIELDNYSRIVSLDEIRRKNYSLSVRKYVDSALSPDRQNLKGHLSGCVPKCEVEQVRFQLEKIGIQIKDIFNSMDKEFFSFSSYIDNKNDIHAVVHSLEEVQNIHSKALERLSEWAVISLSDLKAYVSEEINIVDLQNLLATSFVNTMDEKTILSKLELRGIFAEWNSSILNDLQTLGSTGWIGTIDSWASTYITAIRNKNDLDELEFQVEQALFPQKAQRIAEIKNLESKYKTELMVLDYGADWHSLEKSEIKSLEKRSSLNKTRKDEVSLLIKETTGSEEELSTLISEQSIIHDWITDYARINNLRLEQSRQLRNIQNPITVQSDLIDKINTMSNEEVQSVVTEVFFGLIKSKFNETYMLKVESCINKIESFWDRYSINLKVLKSKLESMKEGLFGQDGGVL